MRKRIWMAAALAAAAAAARDRQPPPKSEFEKILAAQPQAPAAEPAPGSLFSQGTGLGDLARDLRASQAGDLVTVIVADKASALAKGTLSTSRKGNASYSVGAAWGPTKAAGPLANLAKASGESQIEGQGETSRETVLTTTVSARVLRVLANGDLAIEGAKDVQVNSERQAVTVRGIVRRADLSPSNTVRSDRLAALEVRVSGKGVVADAVRRPFLLYRILMGLLPL